MKKQSSISSSSSSSKKETSSRHEKLYISRSIRQFSRTYSTLLIAIYRSIAILPYRLYSAAWVPIDF